MTTATVAAVRHTPATAICAVAAAAAMFCSQGGREGKNDRGKERAKRRSDVILNELEGRIACVENNELARLEHIISERTGRSAAPAIVALKGNALARSSNP